MTSNEKNNVTGETNISFDDTRQALEVDARTISVQPTHIDRVTGNIRNLTFEQLCNRWFQVKKFEWKSTDVSGIELFNMELPEEFLNTPAYAHTLMGMHAFYRFDLRFRIMLNSTKFHVGRAALVFNVLNQRYIVSNSLASYVTWFSGLPHAMIDAASSNVAEFYLPWSHPFSYGASGEYLELGTMYLIVLQQLELSVGASSSVDGSVWVSYENVNVIVPREVLPSPFLGKRPSQNEMVAEAQMFKSLGQTLGGAIDAVAEPIISVVKPIVHLISSLGDNANQTPDTSLNSRTHRLAHSIGPANFNRLAINPGSNLEYTVDKNFVQHDEMDLRYLLSLPMVVDVVDAAEDYIINVSPSCIKPLVLTNTGPPISYSIRSYPSTFLSYFSNLFQYWRGTLQYKIEFVTSMFTTGRIAVVYIPGNVTSWDDKYLNNPLVVMDLHEKRTFYFSVPYVSRSPYKRNNVVHYTLNTTSGALLRTYDSNESQGTLFFHTINDLAYPSNVPKTCNMWIWQSGGPDFEFGVIGDYNTTSVVSVNIPVAVEAEAQMFEPADVTARSRPVEEVYPAIFEVKSQEDVINNYAFGEDYMHLKNIVGRSTYVGSYPVPVDKGLMLTLPATPFDSETVTSSTKVGMLGYIAQAYGMYRGSIRYTIVCDVSRSQRAVAYVTRFNTSPLPATAPFVLSQSYSKFSMPSGTTGSITQNLCENPVITVELPYYEQYQMLPTSSKITTTTHAARVYLQSIRFGTGAGFTNATFQVYVYKSAGDDFRLFFPLSPPFLDPAVITQKKLPGVDPPAGVSGFEMIEAEGQMGLADLDTKKILTGVTIVASVGLLYTGYSLWSRFKTAMSYFGSLASVFAKEAPTILNSLIPIKLGPAMRVFVLKIFINSIDLMRISGFTDFMIWMARLISDFPFMHAITAAAVWRTWETYQNSVATTAQAQSWSDSTLSFSVMIIVGLLSATGYGLFDFKTGTQKKIDLAVMRVKNLSGSIGSLANLPAAVPKLKEAVEGVLFSVFGMCDKKFQALGELKLKHAEIWAWCERVIALNEDDKRDQLSHNKTLQAEVLNLRSKGIEYLKLVCESNLPPNVVTTFRSVFQMSEKLAVIATRGQVNRGYKYEPFCVSFVGKPGVGKSRVSRMMACELMACDGLSGMTNLYSRSAEDPFWSKYAGQHTVMIDDFGKLDPSVATYDPFSEFISLKSAEVYNLNMADLPDKGKLFNSKVLITTTNDAYPKPKTLIDYRAVWRRRDLLWQVESSVGSITLGNYDKLKENDHLRFIRLDPMQNSSSDVGVTWAQCVKITTDFYRRWDNKENASSSVFDSYVPLTKIKPSDEKAATIECGVAQCVDGTLEILNVNAEVQMGVGDEIVLQRMRLDMVKRDGLTAYFPADFVLTLKLDGEEKLIRTVCVEAEREKIFSLYFVELNSDPAMVAYAISVLRRNKLKVTVDSIGASVASFSSALGKSIKENSVKLVVGLVGAGVLVWTASKLLATKEEVEVLEHEIGESQFMPSNPVAKGKVSRVRFKSVTGMGQMGTSEDPSAVNIVQHVMPRNICRLTTTAGEHVQALGVKMRFVLAPAHFFEILYQEDIFFVSTIGREKVECRFDASKLRRYSDEVDWVLYELDLRCPLFKDLVKHFASEKETECATDVPASLVLWKDSLVTCVQTTAQRVGVAGVASCKYSVASEKNGLNEYQVSTGWRYRTMTEKGDCGAPLVAFNKYWLGKLMGIHVAGVPSSRMGWSVAVSRDMLESLLINVPSYVVKNVEPMEADAHFGISGDFTILGSNPSYFNFLQPRSKLRKSGIYSMWEISQSEPAILDIKDERNVNLISPARQAIEKFGLQMPSFKIEHRNYAAEAVVNETLSALVCANSEKRLYSIEEAVAGLKDDESFKSIERDSSVGFPWRFKRKRRKNMISEDYEIADPELLHAVQTRIQHLEKGIGDEVVWLDCLKDEKLPLRKIKEVKTRTFSIAPIDFLIVMRVYFGAFFSAFIKNCNQFYSCVGINPESFEWHILATKLREKGTKGFSFDYSGFDRRVDPFWISKFVDMVNQWYSDEHSRARLILMEQHIHRVSLVLDLFYIVHWGQPSGGFLTTILNSFVNSCYVRYAFQAIKEKKGYLNISADDFLDVFVDRNYGDDGVLFGNERAWTLFTVADFLQAFNDVNLSVTASDDKTQYH